MHVSSPTSPAGFHSSNCRADHTCCFARSAQLGCCRDVEQCGSEREAVLSECAMRQSPQLTFGSGGSFGFTRSFGWNCSPSSSCSFGFSICIRGSHGVDFSLQLALCFDFGPCGSINSDMCVSSNFGYCLLLRLPNGCSPRVCSSLGVGRRFGLDVNLTSAPHLAFHSAAALALEICLQQTLLQQQRWHAVQF